MKKLILAALLCVYSFAADATISVINQAIALPRIAIEDISSIQDSTLKAKFAKIMQGDVRVSSDFEIVDGEGAKERSELVLRYALSEQAGVLSLDTWLINSATGVIKSQHQYSINDRAKYPFLAHKSVVDLVVELGLPPVGWMDKFIVFSRYTAPHKSEIVVGDYTLTYQKVVVSGDLNIFPKWAGASQQDFYYTHIKDGSDPVLYKFNLSSGKKSKVISGRGMLVASDVSLDGAKILLTMAPKDQPDIFIYDTRSKQLSQVTNYAGIDVNANFVDDDTKVVFVSDRMGYPNVFSTSINGGAVEQLVFSGKNNSSVSTFGNYIVYSSREDSSFGRAFNIYLISTKTDFIRQLTASGKNTYPRFSSDGGSVVFIKEVGAQTSLGVIRLNENRSFQFPLKVGKIQSIDW
ncbi:Tol-Pal system protein TolB [Campylobacter sp. 19-13652]|uniref:Tol-Pal system protein TolB n=1 Tax=Campylobacter sp. 19-13652 TaxID=2840180 RepID=UPI001C781664|nr:Tol-Pal system protein TolB [Campylobacter sp. 19-13652]BCX78952.1 protein TolB [Campylobacter sp. 19-13652]